MIFTIISFIFIPLCLSFQPSISFRRSLFRRCELRATSIADQQVNLPKEYHNSIKDDYSIFPYERSEELNAMISTDVSKSDIYYESAYFALRKKRKEPNLAALTAYEGEFYNFMENGFNRRATNEHNFMYDNEKGKQSLSNLASLAAFKTSYHLELGKSKEEQLRDLRRLQRSQRKGFLRFLSPKLLKYYDYYTSLLTFPRIADLLRNMVLATFFSFIMWANVKARGSFIYFVIGNLATTSFLLTRGMPKRKATPGMGKDKAILWSANAFNTAVSITVLSSTFSGFLTLLALLPTDVAMVSRLKLAMIVGMWSTSISALFFEVFEEKSKNGWRWYKAANSMSSDTKTQLANSIGSVEENDKYDYGYDPHISDFPPKPKYVDEAQAIDQTEKCDDRFDELQSNVHFDSWKARRIDARRAPIESAPPESPWVGSIAGMYAESLPNFLSKGYKKNVQKEGTWRFQPKKFIKDTTEFELLDGPKGFRDKKPFWLNLFGEEIWEEKVSLSRRVARAFGAYRKCMWKIDKKVALLSCDGVDKNGDGDDINAYISQENDDDDFDMAVH